MKKISPLKIFKVAGNRRKSGLQAAVLGANDGIISIAGLVIGVAGAAQTKTEILTAGFAGIIAGAMSLAAGEYVSVSTERDSEKAMLAREKKDLINHPKEEFEDLVSIYESDGLSKKDATDVAAELTKANAFAIHADVDLHIDPKHLTNPWSSVLASAIAFIFGAIIPLSAIMLPFGEYSVLVTFVAVIFALVITGILSAKASGAYICRSTLRVVAGGAIAMIVTFIIGSIFHIAGA